MLQLEGTHETKTGFCKELVISYFPWKSAGHNLKLILIYYMNRDSSVDMYGWGLNPGRGKFFLLSQRPRRFWGPPSGFFSKGKPAWNEAAYLPPIRAVVKNGGAKPPLPPYVFFTYLQHNLLKSQYFFVHQFIHSALLSLFSFFLSFPTCLYSMRFFYISFFRLIPLYVCFSEDRAS
jgi:hypothetical protein